MEVWGAQELQAELCRENPHQHKADLSAVLMSVFVTEIAAIAFFCCKDFHNGG